MGEDIACVKEANEATKISNKEERVSLDLSHLGIFLDYNLGQKP